MIAKAVDNEVEDSFGINSNVQVPDVDDEYGGFGSLTELAKNKDKLAEKVINAPPKGDALIDVKAKMKEKLDQAAAIE